MLYFCFYNNVFSLKFLFRILDTLLYTSIYAGICAVAMCMATEKLLLGHVPSVVDVLHIFIFSSTLVIYNAHYLFKKMMPGISDRYDWTQRHKYWHYITGISGIFFCTIAFFYLSWSIRWACVVLCILSIGYSFPIFPVRNNKRLRDVGWVKILLLCSVWTIVTAVLPMLFYLKSPLHYSVEIAIRFVLLFILCIMFDIRDMQTDAVGAVFTLPNRIGEQRSYKLIYYNLLFFVLLSLIQYLRYHILLCFLGEVATTIFAYWVIIYTRRHPSDRAYLGLADGIMLAYAILVCI